MIDVYKMWMTGVRLCLKLLLDKPFLLLLTFSPVIEAIVSCRAVTATGQPLQPVAWPRYCLLLTWRCPVICELWRWRVSGQLARDVPMGSVGVGKTDADPSGHSES